MTVCYMIMSETITIMMYILIMTTIIMIIMMIQVLRDNLGNDWEEACATLMTEMRMYELECLRRLVQNILLPTKHLSILVSPPFQHLICTSFMHLFNVIQDKYALNLVLFYHNFFLIYAETVPFNDAIWDEFNEQHQHQSIKKCTKLVLF